MKETKPNGQITSKEQETAPDKNSNNNWNSKNDINNKNNNNTKITATTIIIIVIIIIKCRSRYRTPTATNTELLVTLDNGRRPLSNIKKSPASDAVFLDLVAIMEK